MHDLAYIKEKNKLANTVVNAQRYEALEEDWKKLRTAIVDVKSVVYRDGPVPTFQEIREIVDRVLD